jgi:glycine dehydrogenase
MLASLGLSTIEELVDQTVPNTIRSPAKTAFEHRGKTIIGLDSESNVLKKMN